ncbi:MAG: hypothetical protein ACRC68_00485 [Clostridium sp.]
MNYGEIENKYINAGLINYKFTNALEVKKILGYDFRTMRGFKGLTDSDKELAEWLICKYINGHGLTSREATRPLGIKRENAEWIEITRKTFKEHFIEVQ